MSLPIPRRLWNDSRLQQTLCASCHGYHLGTSADYTGKHSQYRYHIEDPIPFQESLLFSIEHGHANNLGHDYSSTAYWYQTEPHWHCVELLPVGKRLPRLWGGMHI